MKIGLVRHFEVDCHNRFLMTSAEFKKWVGQYDCSPVKPVNLALEDNWDKCYCSDLPRAIETAQHIYKGDIIQTHLLREIPIAPVVETNVKLPYLFWLMAGRLAWYCSHQSQTESLSQSKDRVQRFLSEVLEEGNFLIVTHGFLMMQIQQELLNRGFSGKRIWRAKFGQIYLFKSC